MYTLMLKNRFKGCHGNHAFFHSAIEFIFEDKNSLHFWGPNERFGTHEKLSWGRCKVGQISSRGMTLSQRIGVVEINTLWLFRYLQLAKKRTKVVSFHRLSGTGMTSLIHLSPLLKCLMTVCPSSLHSCVQGTNFSSIPW